MKRKEAGEKLRKILADALKERGKSARWLAIRAQVNESGVHQTIRGEIKNPSFDIVFRLLAALRIDPTDFAREMSYLPPYNPDKLPDNLRTAMRRGDWPPDVQLYELESLATWGMMAEGDPELVEATPEAYRMFLEELRGKPIDKIARLFEAVPRHVQDMCYQICRSWVNDWRSHEKLREGPGT